MGAIGLIVLVSLLAAMLVPGRALGALRATPDWTFTTDGDVEAIVTSGGVTYIGGSFTHVGLPSGAGAGIDATTGSALELPQVTSHNGSFTPTVYAVVADGSGGWYIGGNFDRVGGVERHRIAHIRADGSLDPVWDPVGATSTNPVVYALALSGSTLFVGGQFSAMGGSHTNLAALDAASGTARSGWDPAPDAAVRALAVSPGGETLYAGGGFYRINTPSGQQVHQSIAAVDAATGLAEDWNARIQPSAASVYALALSSDGSMLYAGGYFTKAGTAAASRSGLAALDTTTGEPTSWNPSPTGTVYALAISGGTVYAGGSFTHIGGADRNRIAGLSASDGAAIPLFNANASGDVYVLRVSGTSVYAGGPFTTIGGQPRNRLAALTLDTGAATGWNPGASGAVWALAVDGPTVYAGGNFTRINDQVRNRIAALDAAGRLTPWDPNANDSVTALAVRGSTVYAGGAFGHIGGQDRARVAALDAETAQATPFNPGADGSIDCLVATDGAVYAGGYFENIGGQARNNVAKLDPVTGNAVAAWDARAEIGPSGYYVDSLALSRDGKVLYVGGLFDGIGGVHDRAMLAAVNTTNGDATTWNPGPVEGATISALVPYRSALDVVFIGGTFDKLHWSSYRGVAEANAAGTVYSWAPQVDPSGIAAPIVSALAVTPTTVYIGGMFSAIGTEARTNLGAVSILSPGNPTAWDPRPDGSVRALALSGSTLHVGGHFTRVAGTVQQGYARFSDDSAPPRPTNTSLPTITGEQTEGQTLSEHHGSWTNNPTSYVHQWQRCDSAGANCTSIAGATGQSYALTGGDVGHTVRVQETATNAGGTGDPATSVATAVIRGAAQPPPSVTAPSNIRPPTISGTPTVGKVLSASTGTWSGSGTLSYAYQWQRCKPGCADIAGARAGSYVLTATDQGATIRVSVTATNAAGSAGATSAAVGPVAAAPGVTPDQPTTAQIKALLVKMLPPAGKASKIGTLLKQGSYTYGLRAPAAGRITIAWYYLPKGARIDKPKDKVKPVLIASGNTTFARAGTITFRVKLTTKGRQLLRRARSMKITAKATHTSRTAAVSATRTFTLKR